MAYQDHDDTFDGKSNYSKEDIRSKGANSDKLSKSITSNQLQNSTVNNFKYELPDSCFISMMKGVKIEKLD